MSNVIRDHLCWSKPSILAIYLSLRGKRVSMKMKVCRISSSLIKMRNRIVSSGQRWKVIVSGSLRLVHVLEDFKLLRLKTTKVI